MIIELYMYRGGGIQIGEGKKSHIYIYMCIYSRAR